MASEAERNQQAVKRWKAQMETEFTPAGMPGHNIGTDERVARSLEYIAAQMGQIRETLKLLLELQQKDRSS